MTRMTRLTALLLTALLAFSVISAAAEEGPLAGGWTAASDPTVTQERSELFDKALDGLVGAKYTPVALLSTQVVAGMNYCILCQITPVVPDGNPSWALVYIYADLQGNAEITNVYELYIDQHSAPAD